LQVKTVQNSVVFFTDLFGLLVFLGADPYCVDTWWDILVQGPFNGGNPAPLCDLVCPLMWRTAKVDVEDQINIPPQKDFVHWINFSPIEENFYRRQHVDCGREVLERITRLPSLDVKLHSLTGEDLNKILWPLTNLRKACCHPQAVKGKHGQQIPSKNKNKTMTMQELLTNLIQKAKSECEESLRMIISSINGT
jgi:E3 ubiquitin-protein ligase SHPRH